MTYVEAVERAVACALEITATCGHYQVKLKTGSEQQANHAASSASLLEKIFPLKNLFGGAAKVEPSDSSRAQTPDSMAFLDVHCGVSAGLMAGISVGHEERWEYFLAGNPLNDVATAEGQANKGEVVISEEAHHMLHGQQLSERMDGEALAERLAAELEANNSETANNNNTTSSKTVDYLLPCGCTVVQQGFCRVSRAEFVPPHPRPRRNSLSNNRSRARKENIENIIQQNVRLVDDILQDIDSLYQSLQPAHMKLFDEALRSYAKNSSWDEKKDGEKPPSMISFHALYSNELHSSYSQFAMQSKFHISFHCFQIL